MKSVLFRTQSAWHGLCVSVSFKRWFQVPPVVALHIAGGGVRYDTVLAGRLLLLLKDGGATGERNPHTILTVPDGLVSIVHNVEPYDEDGC